MRSVCCVRQTRLAHYVSKLREKCKAVKRCFSLKRNKEFRRVYRRGKSKSSRLFVLVYTKCYGERVHIGFSVSKKIGNSVVRNRVKRRLRESFGPMMPDVKKGHDLIFIAREPVANADFTEIVESMRTLLRRAELL